MMIDPSTVALPPITRTASGDFRIGNMLTRREFAEIERIRNSQWFLIRNDGGEIGERGACRWHIADPMSGKRDEFEKPVLHPYFTLMCCERPFAGLEFGLRAWVQVAGESERKRQIEAGFGIGLRDYSESHPQTAAALRPTTPDAIAWYSLLLGISVPIDEDKAREYAQRIKDKRPPVFPPELRVLLMPKSVIRSIRSGGI